MSLVRFNTWIIYDYSSLCWQWQHHVITWNSVISILWYVLSIHSPGIDAGIWGAVWMAGGGWGIRGWHISPPPTQRQHYNKTFFLYLSLEWNWNEFLLPSWCLQLIIPFVYPRFSQPPPTHKERILISFPFDSYSRPAIHHTALDLWFLIFYFSLCVLIPHT